MTNDPTSAAIRKQINAMLKEQIEITGDGWWHPKLGYSELVDAIEQAIVEAETRGRMIATALFCENNGGSIEVSRSAMVSVPRSSFHIDSYVEPSTEGTVFILYKEDEQANADGANDA